MVVTKTRMTAEELMRLPHDGYRYELVEGELRMTPVGGEHGDIAGVMAYFLIHHVRPRQLGKVVVETGFCLECQPDTVVAPDVAFLSAARVPPGGRLPRKFISGAPDLAVEVLSPTNTASEIQAKVRDYLAHGTRLVWVIDPDVPTVTVYRADGSTQSLQASDVLRGEDVVPGFALQVAELFA